MASRSYSTYQAAKICDVHYTTVINWIDEGALNGYSTPGGHRRIKKEDLISFMQEKGMPVPLDLGRDKKLVLIVDDDNEFLDEMGEFLMGHGFDIDLASGGFDAARKIYKKKPDLILLDFKMPGLDGFGVCELLKKDEETSHIPIIAVTALNSKKEIQDIKASGVLEHIPKPVDLEKLLVLATGLLGIENELVTKGG